MLMTNLPRVQPAVAALAVLIWAAGWPPGRQALAPVPQAPAPAIPAASLPHGRQAAAVLTARRALALASQAPAPATLPVDLPQCRHAVAALAVPGDGEGCRRGKPRRRRRKRLPWRR